METGTKWPRFADAILESIFFDENCEIFIQISLKFVPYGPINNTLFVLQCTDYN